MYQLPKIEDGPVDVDITELELNMDFKENAPQQEKNIHEVCDRIGKEYPQELLNCTHRLIEKIIQRYLPKWQSWIKY